MAPKVSAMLIFLLLPHLLHADDKHSPYSSTLEARADFLPSRIGLAMRDSVPMGASLPDTRAARKSVGLAVLYSLLLPGMGELYAGSFSSGRYFLAGEGALWLTYAGMDIYAVSVRDDARQFAAVHAGLNPAGKDDQYFVNVSNFLTVDAYNQQKLQDRTPEKLYDPSAGYGWQWDSDANRAVFRAQRITGERAFNNLRFVVAAIVVNHIASAINAARSVIARNNAESGTGGEVQIGANVLGDLTHPQGIAITVAKTF